MDKRKLAFAAGGASIVAAALAMNVGAAAAVGDCDQVVECGGGGVGGGIYSPLQKIEDVMQKLQLSFDKPVTAIDSLQSVLNKLALRFD